MKKVFFFSAIFALCSLVSFAQETKFGLRAGVNLAKLSFSNDSELEGVDHKNLINFSFSGYADLPLSENFSIQPGLGVNGKGSRFANPENSDERMDINLLYVDVPVYAVGKLPVSFGKIIFGAGPYFGYAVSGKVKTVANGQSDSEKINFGNNADDDLSPIDYGANFLAGVEISNGFTVHAGYGLGIANLVTKPNREASDAKVNTRALTFGVGFLF